MTETQEKKSPCGGFHAAVRQYMDEPLIRLMHRLASIAIRLPWTTVWACVALSLVLVGVGLSTNFTVDTNEDTLYTPIGSRPLEHSNYIDKKSGFSPVPRPFRILVHQKGNNILGVEGITRAFEAIDTLRNSSGFLDVCPDSGKENDKCTVLGATRFWNNDLATFVAQGLTTDAMVQHAVSAQFYADGGPVDIPSIMGNVEYDSQNVNITRAESLFLTVLLPDNPDTEDFEASAIESFESLQGTLRKIEDGYQVEYFTERSFSDEFERAIVDDTPLIPMVFVLMSIFTCLVFFRRDATLSRSLLGFGAVCSVLMAILSGYGLLFILGTPLTSMTQILPFIIFGIGLDDSFIISGAFFRTDATQSIEKRIHATVEEVGLSIFLTTTTSTIAFALGAISSIPTVRWLCLYAFPTILLVFTFQLTFFVALLVIDDRRVSDQRRDCIVCFTVQREDGDSQRGIDSSKTSCFDDIINRFANLLMMPRMKILVVLSFTGLFVFLSHSAAQLTQEFQFTDVVPDDSYVTDYWDTFALLSTQGGVTTRAYFRNVDQSIPQVQAQMENYINSLVEIKAITRQPAFFWLRDFQEYVDDNNLSDLSFVEQMDAFLGDPIFQTLYGEDIVRDAQGKVFESRVELVMDNVNQEVVSDQIDALLDQRSVSDSMPINQGKSDWSFFTFDSLYFIWEFYAVARDEVIFTTIVGVAAVTFVAFAFIPHWSSALFVFPLISMCYVDLLGALQLAGLHVNVVTYIALVMSIGLLVDYLMHTLLAYMEAPGHSKEDKVRHLLKTTGSSVFIGAVSTLLGVVPLACSTSEIFRTVFLSFAALVTIGAGHGLIFLPVVLSYFGPLAGSTVDGTPGGVVDGRGGGGTMAM